MLTSSILMRNNFFNAEVELGNYSQAAAGLLTQSLSLSLSKADRCRVTRSSSCSSHNEKFGLHKRKYLLLFCFILMLSFPNPVTKVCCNVQHANTKGRQGGRFFTNYTLVGI